MKAGVSGIYRIDCGANGKVYVGSTINLTERWRQHRRWLRNGTHHSPRLQHAWNKYGEQAFQFTLIEHVPAEHLLEREQYWLDMLRSYEPHLGYNISRVAGSRLGLKHSPETRLRLSKSHTGIPLGEVARRKLSEHWQGRTFEDAHRARISAAKMGHTVSAEARAKISSSKTGHTYSAETYAGRMKRCVVTSPDGTEYVVLGMRRFCREHGLDLSTLMRVAKGEQTHHKGWTARLID